MKLYLLSDNTDTCMGMRLAGIEGVVLHERDEVEQAVRAAVENPEIGIVLITEKLAELCSDLIREIKLGHRKTLIVEVPDRHGGKHINMMEQYISEAIGIKF